MPLKEEQKLILNKYQYYYQQLNQKQKVKFERRLKTFMFNKKFIARQMPKVTDEMKVLISSSAVQLTFGMDFTFFSHFRKILVYPDSYYSKISKTYHNGEVNPKLRVIIVSWKYFVSGYMDQSDGRNLGLHEMAHAIKLENRVHPFMGRAAWGAWYHLAEQHMSYAGRGMLFRDYAFTNYHEFFAVAVENFFERPLEFKHIKPELYESMVYLLKQDPIKIGRSNVR
ncbi:zinc-dependent peptidase [Marivirga sp. S37H4]|uniref:Zinc-dependent peptidase n=1 Tax=Marivirga aurantiaca TaxID=2802615 RepID=A0A935C5Z0_9BACT|nr:zinc-dependent peptidase [Marivirga aurantiaca]